MSAIPDNIVRMHGIADTRVVAVEQSLLVEAFQVGRNLSAIQLTASRNGRLAGFDMPPFQFTSRIFYKRRSNDCNAKMCGRSRSTPWMFVQADHLPLA